MVSKNMFHGANLTLNSDVDQDTHLKAKQAKDNTTHKRAKRSVLSQQVTTRLQETEKTAQQRQT